MAKVSIPPTSENTIEYVGLVTFDAEWLGLIRGAILQLTRGRYWDESTGNVKDAQQRASFIYEEYSAMPLQDIVDAINNLAPINTIPQLTAINVTLQDIANRLSNISEKLDSQGASIADLIAQQEQQSVDLGGVENGLAMLVDNLALIKAAIGYSDYSVADAIDANTTKAAVLFGPDEFAGIPSLRDILFALGVTAEQARAYEGVKLDFYGQTMTSQNEQIREVVRAIASQQTQFTVFTQYNNDGSVIAGPVPEVVDTSSESCLNAVTMWLLYGKMLRAIDQAAPQLTLYPSHVKTVIVDELVKVYLGLASADLNEAKDGALGIVFAMQNQTFDATWSDIVNEWESTSIKVSFICHFCVTGGLPNELTSADVFEWIDNHGTASDDLKFALHLIKYVDNISFVNRDYLGGNGGPFEQFALLRDQIRDGFDIENYVPGGCV